MHLSLSDLVTCPRCGPAHGLVLLPGVVTARRVSSGLLGCANCRERYRITDGVADLRAGGATEAVGEVGEAGDGGVSQPSAAEAGVRLGALLGLAAGSGPVLVAGPGREAAAALSDLLEVVEAVHVGRGGMGSAARVPGVSSILADGGLPFRTGSMSGVALTGDYVAWLEEGLRVLRPGARLLVEPGHGLAEKAEAAGGRVVVAEGEVLVLRGPGRAGR